MSSIQTTNVVRSVKWVSFVKLLSQFAAFSTTIVISNFLSKDELGLSAMAFVVMGFIDSLIDFGFGAAIIQRKEISKTEFSSCFWLLTIFGAMTASILYFAAPLFGSTFNDPRINELLKVMALTFFVMPIQILYRGILNRAYKLVALAKADFIGLLIRSTVSIAFAASGYGVWSIIFGFMAEKVVISGVLVFITHWLPTFHLNLQELKPLASFGAKITIGRIIYFLLSRADVIIVGRLLGAEILGAYNLALQFSGVIFQLITSTGISVAYPLFSRLRNTENFLKQVGNFEQLVALIAIPSLAGLTLIAPDIIALSLGDHWSESSIYLQYLCIATIFQALGFLLPQAMNAINKTVINIYINGISLIIYFVSLYIAGYYGGIQGILSTIILLAIIRFCAILIVSRRVLGIKIRELLTHMVGVGLVTIGAMTPTFFLANKIFPQTGSYPRVIFMVVIGAASYLLLQIFFYREKTIAIYQHMVKR